MFGKFSNYGLKKNLMLTYDSNLKAIESNRHWKMKKNQFLIEHLGIQRLEPINLVCGALKTGDLKNDIPYPAHRSWGGFV